MKLRKTDLLLNYTEQEEMLPKCCKPPNVVFYYLASVHPILFLTFIFCWQIIFSYLLSFLDSGIPRPVENFVFIVHKLHRNFDGSVRNTLCLSVTNRQAGRQTKTTMSFRTAGRLSYHLQFNLAVWIWGWQFPTHQTTQHYTPEDNHIKILSCFLV
jgi:hypothetical protein